MRVLATGANGFLGRQIVQRLMEGGATRVVASDIIAGPLSQPNLTPLSSALHDAALLDAACDREAAIHLAATLGSAAETGPAASVETNVSARALH